MSMTSGSTRSVQIPQVDNGSGQLSPARTPVAGMKRLPLLLSAADFDIRFRGQNMHDLHYSRRATAPTSRQIWYDRLPQWSGGIITAIVLLALGAGVFAWKS